MKNIEKYQKLAQLIVKRGVNVQKGQPVLIRIAVDQYEFARILTKEAYKAGASTVEIDYRDTNLAVCRSLYEDEEALCNIPDWQYDREKYRQSKGICSIGIVSSSPDAYKDADNTKMTKMNIAYSKKTKDLQPYFMNNIGQWCVAGIPSIEWAKVVFPELDDQEAFDKLEEAIFKVSRIDDNDPIDNWVKHDETLANNAKKMNEYQFDKMHFVSELGTDLYVGLVKNHKWVGGNGITNGGILFDPNIPTEEIFCMPDNTDINGIVYASKPLLFSGDRIEDFYLVFKDGKVVDYDAKKGKESLKALIETDEGSSSLGEVALVPYDSPVSDTGILFSDTLYDENAACHLALGACYPENIEGGYDMNDDDFKVHHCNDSAVHEDFMFGTRELSADGITKDGEIIPIFRHGNFIF